MEQVEQKVPDTFKILVLKTAMGFAVEETAGEIGLTTKQARDILSTPFMRQRLAQVRLRMMEEGLVEEGEGDGDGEKAKNRAEKIIRKNVPIAASRLVEHAIQDENPGVSLSASTKLLGLAGLVEKKPEQGQTVNVIVIPDQQAALIEKTLTEVREMSYIDAEVTPVKALSDGN